MTKSFTLGIIAAVGALFFAFSFKMADNDKKEYVTIYCNDFHKDMTLSYSNGTFKAIEYQKKQGNGDQTQILKVINEHESQGYKLVNYDNKSEVNLKTQVTSVLMCK